MPDAESPNIAVVLARVLVHVPREQQPLLIAFAERLAAERYRGWADEPEAAPIRAELRACADREEEIARRIESLYPDAASVQRAVVESNPDLLEVNRMLFAGRPLVEQFQTQAEGERLGAATWRAFGAHAKDAAARDVFVGCAALEEESAVVLEKFIAEHA